MRKRFAAITAMMLIIAAGATTGFAWLQGANLPIWPQRFDIPSGGRASFAIPVTQPGQLSVRVTWSGEPLSVMLFDPAGNTADSSAPVSGSVVRNFTVTRAQADAVLFVLRITSTGTGGKNRHVGEVNVQAPPIDAAKLSAAVTSAQNAAASSQSQAKAEMESKRDALKLRLDKAAADRMATLKNQIQQKVRSFQKTPATVNLGVKPQSNVQPSSNPTAGLNNIASKPAFAAPRAIRGGNIAAPRPGILQADLAPILDSLAPQFIRPDVDIKLIGTNLVRPDKWSEAEVKTKCSVLFSITPDITIEAPVIAAQKVSDDKTQITVKVPPAPILDVTGIYVSIKTTAWSVSQSTDPQSATYDPFSPVIESVSPAAAYADDIITIRGRNFLNSTTVIASLAGGNNMPAVIVSHTANEIKVKTPANPVAATSYKGLLQCKTQWLAAPGYGNTADFTFLIPPKISQAFPANGEPRDPILLIGNNFKAPAKVHFKDTLHNNEMVVAGAVDSSELVEAAIPDFGAIPLAGIMGSVAVECDGKLGPWIPFKFDPHIAEVYFDNIRYINNPTVQKYPDNRFFLKYTGDFLVGHSGYDYFMADMNNLKNGWSIVGLDFEHGGYRGEARLEGNPGVTNGVGNATVRWWDDCFFGNGWYYIGFKIKGPSGLPYR